MMTVPSVLMRLLLVLLFWCLSPGDGLRNRFLSSSGRGPYDGGRTQEPASFGIPAKSRRMDFGKRDKAGTRSKSEVVASRNTGPESVPGRIGETREK